MIVSPVSALRFGLSSHAVIENQQGGAFRPWHLHWAAGHVRGEADTLERGAGIMETLLAHSFRIIVIVAEVPLSVQ
jgi:hypothetical protein